MVFSRSLRGAVIAAPGAAAIAILGGAPSANAQLTFSTSVYSNVSTFQSYYTQGGATTTAATSATKMLADDITLQPEATGAITSFSFSMVNVNSATVSAEPTISIFDASGSSGGPGTLLAAIAFGPISMASDTYNVFTINNPTNSVLFTVPSTFWVGETFDNLNGATATSTQLNSFGEGIFNPPTVGSSANHFFISTNTGTAADVVNNPAGNPSFYFTGSTAPQANFGFAFSGAAFAPEPSAVALLIPGALAVAGGLIRRRRMK